MIIDNIIGYISSCFASDNDFSGGISVLEAFKYSHKITDTEIQVRLLNDAESAQYTTFEGEKASNISVQFDVYGAQMTIGNAVVSAQKAAEIIADKLKHYFVFPAVHTAIPDVLKITRSSVSPSIPLESGTALYSVSVRAEMITKF